MLAKVIVSSITTRFLKQSTKWYDSMLISPQPNSLVRHQLVRQQKPTGDAEPWRLKNPSWSVQAPETSTTWSLRDPSMLAILGRLLN